MKEKQDTVAKQIKVSKESAEALSGLSKLLGVPQTKIINGLLAKKTSLFKLVDEIQTMLKDQSMICLKVKNPKCLGVNRSMVDGKIQHMSIHVNEKWHIQNIRNDMYAISKQTDIIYLSSLNNENIDHKMMLSGASTVHGKLELIEYFDSNIDPDDVVIEETNILK